MTDGRKSIIFIGTMISPGYAQTSPGIPCSINLREISSAYTGDVEISIDGEPWRRSPTWDGWVLQAPERINYKIWADDLPDGPHQLRLRIADGSQWAKCQGNNIRLIAFMTAKF